MKTKFKTLLKTTVAVTTLMMGSQSWGTASIIGEDGTTEYAATGREMKGLVRMDNKGTAASAANFTTASGTVLYYVQTAANNPTGKWTFGSGTKIHLKLTNPLALTEKFTSPKGDSVFVVDDGTSAFTLGTTNAAGSIDQSQFELHVLSNVTVDLPYTPAKLSLPVEIAKGKILTTAATNITSVTGRIKGDGDLTLNAAATKVSSDLSGLKGKLTTGAEVTFTSSLAGFTGTLVLGADQDFSDVSKNLTQTLPQNVNLGGAHILKVPAGTIKKVIASVGIGTVNAMGPLVIEELDVSAIGVTLTGTGGDITIKKVTGNNDITISGGNVIIKSLNKYVGDIKTTVAGATLSFQ